MVRQATKKKDKREGTARDDSDSDCKLSRKNITKRQLTEAEVEMIEDELHAYYEKYKYLVESQKHHRNFTLDNIDDFAKGIHSKVSKLKMVQNKIKREHEREAEAIAKSDYLLE